MSKPQNARHQANERAALFMVAHDAEMMLLVLYASLKTDFNSKMLGIYHAIQKQYEQTGFITLDKNLQRELVGSTVLKFAHLGSVQAYVLNRPELSVALDISPSFLTKGSDNDILVRANGILKIIKDNSGILTQITTTDILEMTTVISDFKNLISVPKSEIKLKKAEGTDPIPSLLNNLDEIKDNIGKLIRIYLPELYKEWLTLIKVGIPIGVRQTSLEARFTDAETGVPLRKVKTTLTNGVKSFSKYSTSKGYVHFYSLESDNYTMTSEHVSFIPFEKSDIGINDQHIEKMDVKLQKINSFLVKENTAGILCLIAYDTESGEPIPNVLVSIPEMKHSQYTDEDGEDYADGIKPGKYLGNLFYDGFNSINFTCNIEAGKTCTLLLYMNKK